MKKISASITLCLTVLTLSTSAYANDTQTCRSQDRGIESAYAFNFSQLKNFGTPHVSEKSLHTRLSGAQGQTVETVWAGANISANLYAVAQVQPADNFTLTQAQRDEVSQLSTHEQYPRMHLYLKKLSDQEKASAAHNAYKENIDAVSIWLERASAINFNDGSWHSEMARGSLAFAAATQGNPLSDEAFQKVSDALAKNIATLIVQRRSIPTLDQLIELEIQSTVSALKLETWHWPGTLTDSLPLQAGGLGHDFVHIPGSGVVYVKNLLIAVMQYAAGLNRYLWSFTTLDMLPLWKYAKEFQRYAADHTYKLFRWLGAGEDTPQQDEDLATHPACTLRDPRDKTIYRLNLSEAECRTIEYIDGPIIPIRLSFPQSQAVDSAWRGNKIDLRVHYASAYKTAALLDKKNYRNPEKALGIDQASQKEKYAFNGIDAKRVITQKHNHTWLARRIYHNVLLSYQYNEHLVDFEQADEFVMKFAGRTIQNKE